MTAALCSHCRADMSEHLKHPFTGNRTVCPRPDVERVQRAGRAFTVMGRHESRGGSYCLCGERLGFLGLSAHREAKLAQEGLMVVEPFQLAELPADADRMTSNEWVETALGGRDPQEEVTVVLRMRAEEAAVLLGDMADWPDRPLLTPSQENPALAHPEPLRP